MSSTTGTMKPPPFHSQEEAEAYFLSLQPPNVQCYFKTSIPIAFAVAAIYLLLAIPFTLYCSNKSITTRASRFSYAFLIGYCVIRLIGLILRGMVPMQHLADTKPLIIAASVFSSLGFLPLLRMIQNHTLNWVEMVNSSSSVSTKVIRTRYSTARFQRFLGVVIFVAVSLSITGISWESSDPNAGPIPHTLKVIATWMLAALTWVPTLVALIGFFKVVRGQVEDPKLKANNLILLVQNILLVIKTTYLLYLLDTATKAFLCQDVYSYLFNMLPEILFVLPFVLQGVMERFYFPAE
ncbi:hypothetical protein HDV05_002434 [Chytridiales sp. JEL 0842]|nr:hypothetical protein HDV05_002434 [Chytridiales sp. JEL 0842]